MTHPVQLLLEAAFRRARSLPRRVWIMVGGAVVASAGLLALGIAAIVWTLWSHVPTATEAGRRLLGRSATEAEQLAPVLRDHAGRWFPDVAAELERFGGASDIPAADGSGADVGPVTRPLGLIRSEFVRGDTETTSVYLGRLPMADVLSHYVAGFSAAGYVQEVISATAKVERHRFVSADRPEAFELSLEQRNALLEVTLTQQHRSSPEA
jgi:hypothetical protein